MEQEFEKLVALVESGSGLAKGLQKFHGRLEKERGGVDLGDYRGSMRALDALTTLLNTDSTELRVKERSLAILARLSLWDANVETVFSVLQKLEGFDAYLTATSDIDPSVTNKLHLHLMTILFRSLETGFKGADLMELTGSVPVAVDALVAVFSCTTLPPAVHVAAASTLADLTRPDAYFSEEECTNSASINDLTAKFAGHLNTLVAMCLEKKLLVAVCSLLQPWMAHTSTLRDRYASESSFILPLQTTMACVLRFINNLMLFSTSHSAKFRKHISIELRFNPDVVLPFVRLCLDILKKSKEEDKKHSSLFTSLCDAIGVLVVSTCRIKVLRQFLLLDGTVSSVVDEPDLINDLRLLSLIIKLHINLDFLSGKKVKGAPSKKTTSGRSAEDRLAEAKAAEGDDTVPEESLELLTKLKEIVSGMSDVQRGQLHRKLSATDPSSPVNKLCVSYTRMAFAFDEMHYRIEKAESVEVPSASLPPALGLPVVLPSTSTADDGDDDDDDDEELQVLHTPRLGKSALAMLEDWQTMKEAVVSTRVVADGTADAADSGERSGGTAEGAGSGAGAGAGAGGESKSPELATVSTPPPTASSTLAPLSGVGARAPHHIAPLSGLTRNPVDFAPPPPELMCGLTSQLMVDPVRTPAGDVYDMEAITDYINEHGKDPSTSDPLAVSQLAPADDVKLALQKYHFQRLLGRRPLL